jgi:hypothetical protein
MEPDVALCIDEAARYLAREPAAIDRALSRHRPDADGRCTGCGRSAPPWPCAVASSATLALELGP